VTGPRRKGNGKIEQAIDKAQETVTPERALVQLHVLPDAVQIQNGAVMNLKVRPSEHPHLLVWLPEAEAYQPVFLPLGSTWQIVEPAHAPTRALWRPGMPS
jgi:hypothetical protein